MTLVGIFVETFNWHNYVIVFVMLFLSCQPDIKAPAANSERINAVVLDLQKHAT